MELTVPTVEHQTGYRRPHPKAICQDGDILRKVFLYDYDSSNKDFITYCATRGVLNALPPINSPYWERYTDWDWSEADFLLDKSLWRDLAGNQHDSERMRFLFGITHRARGSLQDAWQLYLEQL